jgi:hypothetical protein
MMHKSERRNFTASKELPHLSRGEERPMAKEKSPVDTEAITVRMSSAALKVLDDWRRRQDDLPDRPEAIRRLVEQAVTSADTRPITVESQHKAAELAEREIDKVADRDLPPEERAQRKRRLIKGPSEFREIRAKRAKSKK